MTDQRSAFRFRVPRLRPPVPPPRPTTSPTQTTARRPPIRPQQQPSPFQVPTRPQVDPSPRPPSVPVRPQGRASDPLSASALPSVPEGTTAAPPPARPQGTTRGPTQASALPSLPSRTPTPTPTRAQPLPVAALAVPPPSLPVRPQDTTPTPQPQESDESPPTAPLGTVPALPPELVVEPSITPQDEPALPPTVPIHPLGTVPASPPEPVVEPSITPQDEPALPKTPSPAPALPPTEPIHPLGMVPALPPEPVLESSTTLKDEPSVAPASQPEPPVEPTPASIAPQDEPPSVTPKPTQAAPYSPFNSSILPKLKTAKPQESTKAESQPSSPSQTTKSRSSSPPSISHVSAKPPPSSKPSSSPHSPPKSPPFQVKRSTEIASNNGQRGADPIIEETPTKETNQEIHEEALLSSAHSKSEPHIRDKPRMKTEENHHESEDAASTTSNIPNKSQTKRTTSLPEDKIPVHESPKHSKPNGPQAPYCGETTGTNLPNNRSNEKSPSVITLAGENRGTSMHIGTGATKRHWKIHIRRKYKVNPDEIMDTTTDEEESSKENDLKHDENKEKSEYINCNVQGINNSMVYNCSITERYPGVHRGSSSKLLKKPQRSKLKVNITPSQSPKRTIRRRCLRGLLMESSSDSDTNGPQKPRRHGCRYISTKDDKMDAV